MDLLPRGMVSNHTYLTLLTKKQILDYVIFFHKQFGHQAALVLIFLGALAPAAASALLMYLPYDLGLIFPLFAHLSGIVVSIYSLYQMLEVRPRIICMTITTLLAFVAACSMQVLHLCQGIPQFGLQCAICILVVTERILWKEISQLDSLQAGSNNRPIQLDSVPDIENSDIEMEHVQRRAVRSVITPTERT
ncbi:hypothetical protein BX600DRAFT_440123 [Xylariales sp. PMI_506]|nr:hypothetical protein BX600DRAFT_440123 [Xylariales sp. PMI_506]